MRLFTVATLGCFVIGGCFGPDGRTDGSRAPRPGAIVRIGPPGAVVEVLLLPGAQVAQIEGPSRVTLSVDPNRPTRYDLQGDGRLAYGSTRLILRGRTLTVEADELDERPGEFARRRQLSTDGARVEAPPR